MAKVLHSTDSDFNKILSENHGVLADFWATWCNPCQMVSPIIEKIASEYENKVSVIKINIDNDREIAEKFNVQSIPTVILFQDSNEVLRKIGAMSFEDYTNEINKYL